LEDDIPTPREVVIRGICQRGVVSCKEVPADQLVTLSRQGSVSDRCQPPGERYGIPANEPPGEPSGLSGGLALCLPRDRMATSCNPIDSVHLLKKKPRIFSGIRFRKLLEHQLHYNK